MYPVGHLTVQIMNKVPSEQIGGVKFISDIGQGYKCANIV